MRVIGGSLRGRKLAALRGLAIRPTADRVREALFNILGPKSVHANVLDLFAGSGALGIEALSRGARQAVFVDQATSALKVIHKNIEICRIAESCRVVQWDILKNLNCLSAYVHFFDLIFIDPPYNRQMIEAPLRHLADHQVAAPDAIAIVEHDPSEHPSPSVVTWHLTDQRRYGQTQLSFFSFQS